MIDKLFGTACRMVERGLLPVENHPDLPIARKVAVYVKQLFTTCLPGLILFSLTAPWVFFKQLCTPKKEMPYQWTGQIGHFPEIGVATAEYQVSGAKHLPASTWAAWEEGSFQDGLPHIQNRQRSGSALNYWDHPEQVIEKIQHLGLKHYRFSVDWSRIELCPGHTHALALQHYVDFCQELQKAGIEPLVTFHHFNEPLWFAKLGGFENSDNIHYFTRFCDVVFEALSPYVHHWTTINEPALYTFQGYVRGVFPPGKKDLSVAGVVLKNLMKAHCAVYDRLKLKQGSESHVIGISHNILRFQPYHAWNPLEHIACLYATRMTHQAVMQFFKTGDFVFQIPFQVNETYREPNIAQKFDFFGVQYYSDPLLSMTFSKELMVSTCYPTEKMTQMPYRFYPEGLFTALEETRSLQKPIYITETGIDAKNEGDRLEFHRKVFEIISRLIQEGLVVQKAFLWTLQDNFEWDMGWKQRFGLFDREGQMRPVALWLQKCLHPSADQASV